MDDTTRATRRPWFWAALLTLSLAGAGFALRYYGEAFPVLSVDLRMSREEALDAAAALSRTAGLEPSDFRQAASFGQSDPEVQTYVELEGGGPETFARLAEAGPYRPYVWEVRHFAEGEVAESWLVFTPEGEPYGFQQVLPEDAVRPNLDAAAARARAEQGATASWGVDLSQYTLLESSQETRTGGRVDHTFVYQRADVDLGDASARLRLVVAGDRLGEVTHFVHVPEAFLRRYQEMRSANDTLALLSNLIFFLGFFLLAGGIGTFYLMRERRVIWRAPLAWGFVVSLLMALGTLNQLPLSWIGYDTALPVSTFLLAQIGVAVAMVALGTPALAFVFLAAEGLTRRAFPRQPQQWRLWSKGAANSDAVLGRTVGAYLWAGVDLGFVVLFYLIVSRLPGWWIPSETLVDPNLVATPFPWLMALSTSLFAGFWEESLFRGVPIASAKLLGDRFGGTRIWIVAALVIQALVFAAGHANYPQQPSYARVAELFLPALIWGLFYLRFGLLPVILIHFLHNFTFFSVVLFSASAPGLWMDRVLAVAAMATPLAVVLVARVRWGRVRELPEAFRNGAWTPALAPGGSGTLVAAGAGAGGATADAFTPGARNASAAPSTPGGAAADARSGMPAPPSAPLAPSGSPLPAAAHAAELPLPAYSPLGLVVATVVGAAIWAVFSDPRRDAPALEIDRAQAIEIGRAELAGRGVDASGWTAVAVVDGSPDASASFVWETSGADVYDELLGTYLTPPQWEVGFVRFTGPVEERAEDWRLAVGPEGQVLQMQHRLPEDRPGATLDEPEARALAETALREPRDLNAARVDEVSAEARQRPARRDWVFTYRAEGGPTLAQGERRIEIVIAGDEVVARRRFVHVPESWEREERRRTTRQSIAVLGSAGLIVMLMLAGVVTAVVVWSRGSFAVRPAAAVALAMVALQTIGAANGYPGVMATLSTVEPVRAQVFQRVVGLVLAAFLVGGGFGLLAGLAHTWLGRRSPRRGSAVAAGVAAGAILAGATAAALRLTSGAGAPDWPDYAPANVFLPVLQPTVSQVTALIGGTAVLLLLFALVDRVTHGWTRRRTDAVITLLWLGLLLFGIRVEMRGSLVAEAARWLAGGLGVGLVLLVIYRIFRSFGPGIVPVLLAILLAMDEWERALARATPTSVAGALLAALVAFGAALIWCRRLEGPPRTVTTRFPPAAGAGSAAS